MRWTGLSWRADRFGEPSDVLQLVEQEWGPPPAAQVLIRVRSAGVGLPDQLMVRGGFALIDKPPVVPGREAAGEVVAVADGSRFTVGERVMGLVPFWQGQREGAFGTYAYLLESKTVTVPAVLSWDQAGAFMLQFRTAHAALIERVTVHAGQSVVVLGASGNSGCATVQLAHALGCRVIAVTGGPDRVAFCRRNGAHDVLDHRTADVTQLLRALTGGGGVDVVVDYVGGALAARTFQALAPFGTVLVVGSASGSYLQVPMQELLLGNRSVAGVYAGGFSPAADVAAYEALAELAGDRKITAPVGDIVDFADLPRVLDTFGHSRRPGLTVLGTPG